MSPEAADALRRAAAHALVDDLDLPVLDERATHHLFRVLRVRDGDVVTVTDGAGGWRRCRAVAGGAIEIDGDTTVEPEPAHTTSVAFAIPKQDRPEWIVQKLTELGIDRMVLLHAERSVVRWSSDRAEKHVAKLHRVAAEALRQSRGVRLPTIVGPVPALDVLGASHAAEPGAASTIADLGASAEGVRQVAIGPEGGWERDELAAAAGTVRIGSTVLRVETAALVAAAHLTMTSM